MDKNEVIEFYDEFAEAQQDSGINDRIYGLYQRLKSLGLKKSSNVLELGCGVGTLTYLLSKTVREGQVEAVDISPKSITVCRQKIQHPSIRFAAGDVVNYSPSRQHFDFITLFDVLEHIPLERHEELWHNLARLCGPHTRIVINIPNPDSIEFDREHHPELLQVIDLPLPLSVLVPHFDKAGLELLYFETYSIWVENDYQFMVLRKKRPYQEMFLHHQRSFARKAAKKLQRLFVQWRYRYR
jgi:trans-aconitate 2-methyltransferase